MRVDGIVYALPPIPPDARVLLVFENGIRGVNPVCEPVVPSVLVAPGDEPPYLLRWVNFNGPGRFERVNITL